MSLPVAEHTQSVGTVVDASVGHLSVHIPGAHPDEVSFLFGQQPKRLGLSFAASLCFDIVAVLLIILASRLSARNATDSRFVLDQPSDQIIWIAESGPGGGGGGGGNQMPEPPRKAELPGKAKITVPVAKPPELEAPKEATEGAAASRPGVEHPCREHRRPLPRRCRVSSTRSRDRSVRLRARASAAGPERAGEVVLVPVQARVLALAAAAAPAAASTTRATACTTPVAAQRGQAAVHLRGDARADPGSRSWSSASFSPTASCTDVTGRAVARFDLRSR